MNHEKLENVLGIVSFAVVIFSFIIIALTANHALNQRDKAMTGDLNLDGKVDLTDLSIMSDHWSK